MIDTFIAELVPNDFNIIDAWQLQQFEKYVDYVFIFSVIWAIGGTVADEQSRENFDKWIRFKWSKVSNVDIPTEIDEQPVTVFDLCLDYTPFASIKDQLVQFQQSGDSNGPESEKEFLNKFTIQWSVWGREELRHINLNELVFNEDAAKVTPQMF